MFPQGQSPERISYHSTCGIAVSEWDALFPVNHELTRNWNRAEETKFTEWTTQQKNSIMKRTADLKATGLRIWDHEFYLTHRVKVKLRFKVAVKPSLHRALYIKGNSSNQMGLSKGMTWIFLYRPGYRFSNSWKALLCLHLNGKALERMRLVLPIFYLPQQNFKYGVVAPKLLDRNQSTTEISPKWRCSKEDTNGCFF